MSPGEQPDYELRCTDSVDGSTDWSPPQVFAGADEGFFDNALVRTSSGWVVVLARGPNLHATSDFLAQGLWWTTGQSASMNRSAWTPLQRFLDADQHGTQAWMARVPMDPPSPSHRQAETQRTQPSSSPEPVPPHYGRMLAMQHLGRLRRPPSPRPSTSPRLPSRLIFRHLSP